MYDKNGMAFIAKSDQKDIHIIPKMANRHGLITGATGTGKTVTLQTLAETFSRMGVPVFAADVKGDLSGAASAGGNKSSVVERVEKFGLTEQGFKFQGSPVEFWDVFGAQGHKMRTTVSEIGPLLLERLLGLNETQGAVLSLLFKIADDQNLLLLDMKDLREMVNYVGMNRKDYMNNYGNISPATIGAIQRSLMRLETEGLSCFFGEPALSIADLMQTRNGMGVINILASDKLVHHPKVYTTLMLWILSEIFEQMPEVGDPEKPKMVFFFDEAHLLFSDMSKDLLERVDRIVRLIRSKGVGIYFVTQNPGDVPECILGQLGNRIQHALRAYTPRDQKAVKIAADTFRSNPTFDTQAAITELKIGEALISVLDEKGAPTIVERASILPPEGQVGPIDNAARRQLINESLLQMKYAQEIDRESAYEVLTARLHRDAEEKKAEKTAQQQAKETAGRTPSKPQDSFVEDMVKNVGRSMSRQIGNNLARTLTRGIMGVLFGKK
ncbi:Ornithine/acetylornithine aminotransferase [Porphyromonas macacae]|uniref:Ornithine/acetylornithine aminotransferase n=1 Tax=Porphyromonas macacae TaxID=28115 RepID=A0A379EB79_9PORP|nr:helicase HerA-like domain-containing protein [Porphyromonas macacae]SUB89936.1 Ornithine/acetylornithine aminotransferase [Porphyromonas macacae]